MPNVSRTTRPISTAPARMANTAIATRRAAWRCATGSLAGTSERKTGTAASGLAIAIRAISACSTAPKLDSAGTAVTSTGGGRSCRALARLGRRLDPDHRIPA